MLQRLRRMSETMRIGRPPVLEITNAPSAPALTVDGRQTARIASGSYGLVPHHTPKGAERQDGRVKTS
jgi:hypothetical protein